MSEFVLMTPDDLERIASSIEARRERELQESEGRIPPLTQNQAYLGYGRKRVREWVRSGRLKPKPKGKKGTIYLHSELERCLSDDRHVKRHITETDND